MNHFSSQVELCIRSSSIDERARPHKTDFLGVRGLTQLTAIESIRFMHSMSQVGVAESGTGAAAGSELSLASSGPAVIHPLASARSDLLSVLPRSVPDGVH